MPLDMPKAAWIGISSDPEAMEVTLAQYSAQPVFISQHLVGSALRYFMCPTADM